MPERKTSIVGGVIGLLLVANIINYFWSSWGLITIHAKDEPIGQVIKSIERQGWVTIYSNIDPTMKITMQCDRVALPDAMETLAANVEYPTPADADASAGNTTSGGFGGGRGRGGGGPGGAQWHMGFFVGATSAQVKEEIRTFQEGAERSDDSMKIYSFGAPLAVLGDDETSTADPRKQVWPGYKAPSAPAIDPATFFGGAAAEPEKAPDSVQGYLKAFARQSDVWIMAPGAWDPPVREAPPANDSLSSAIRHFVRGANGSVKQAIVLRGRPPRVVGAQNRGGGGFRSGGGGGMFDLSGMEDRVDNAINGLPPEQQPAARAKVAEEKQRLKEFSSLPPDQMMKKMRDHFIEMRMESDNGWRKSPDKRAQMYSKLVSNRIAATGSAAK